MVLLRPNVTEWQRHRGGNQGPQRPLPTGTCPRAAVGQALGWQGRQCDPHGAVPLPLSAQDTAPGHGPGNTLSGGSLVLSSSVGRPQGKGACGLAPPTSGSPSRAGGRRSPGCSGCSPVRSHEAGRSTGRSLGHRVSARCLSPLGRSCRLGTGTGEGLGTHLLKLRGPGREEKEGSPQRGTGQPGRPGCFW